VVVDALTSALDVRAAQVWMVEPGRPALRYVVGRGSDEAANEWVAVGAATPFHRGREWVVGVGAPGVAWGTRQVCFRKDFWMSDGNGQLSRRASAARRGRIRTVCAVPVLSADDVVGVIEIGGSHNYPGNERLPSLVERIGQLFAAFVVSHRSRTAFEALFRHSPDALLLVDAGGLVSRANARAVDLFGDVRGLSLSTLFEDVEALLRGAEDDRPEARAEAASVYERSARRPDGTTFFAEITASALADAAAPATIVAVRDLTERRHAEEALRRSLDEKVTLVQEVHHRVKNNLQVISSLVSLQASDLPTEESRAALLDTSRRIQSMALVHQQIYAGEDLARIDLGEYTRQLCTALRASMSTDATLSFEDAARVEVPIERAVPCGLILNELLTNAFKHGRGAGGRCHVTVRLERTSGGFAFSVEDEGPGYDPSSARRGSMGQTLIAALVRQLRAKRTVVCDGGARVRIEVPDEPVRVT
jgi:PAS domain S-box-containing protein